MNTAQRNCSRSVAIDCDRTLYRSYLFYAAVYRGKLSGNSWNKGLKVDAPMYTDFKKPRFSLLRTKSMHANFLTTLMQNVSLPGAVTPSKRPAIDNYLDYRYWGLDPATSRLVPLSCEPLLVRVKKIHRNQDAPRSRDITPG